MSFSKKDIEQIHKKGLTIDQINTQIELFIKGIPFTTIYSAAAIGEDIMQLDETLINESEAYYNNKKNELSIIKFVPASGAATRMFKFLYKFIREYSPETESINTYINKNNLKELSIFLVGVNKFPFYKQVLKYVRKNVNSYSNLPLKQKILAFVKAMLDKDQLNYGNSPKGLFLFMSIKTMLSLVHLKNIYTNLLCMHLTTKKQSCILRYQNFIKINLTKSLTVL